MFFLFNYNDYPLTVNKHSCFFIDPKALHYVKHTYEKGE